MCERGFIPNDVCAKNATSDLVPSRGWGQDMTVADLDLPDAAFVGSNYKIGQLVAIF